ncbi:MAG: nucleotidyltransferase domain-containing protein [Leptolyngbyaceae cyanobacterium]|uniref:nucleotidyltransferase domain-containing protein n=1 Tax=Leptodesmis TaxID=2664261 RepID=UPI001F3E650D|nr:nucleotidyltransferase domain-containing protein [Leptodesmis sichuanensis]UIE36275.1 nucleotidyltransferase domain-containing protein [Leptodesmis sichuanensis A121]
MKHPQLPAILNALRQYLDGLYGDRLVNVILFGSQARNEAEADSDIDVLVVLKGEVDSWTEIKRTGEGVAKLCLDYSVVICCLFIAETQFQSQQTALLRNVKQEGVSV